MSAPRTHGFWVTNHLANPLLRPLLRSPLGHRLGRRLAVLRYRGRRSGHVRELVVQYVRDGDSVWVVPGQPDRKHWWRNFVEPQPIEVWLAGEHLTGVARVLHRDQYAREVDAALAAYRLVFPRTPATTSVVVAVGLGETPPSSAQQGADTHPTEA